MTTSPSWPWLNSSTLKPKREHMEVCTPSRPTLSPTSLPTITRSSREGALEDHGGRNRDTQDMGWPGADNIKEHYETGDSMSNYVNHICNWIAEFKKSQITCGKSISCWKKKTEYDFELMSNKSTAVEIKKIRKYVNMLNKWVPLNSEVARTFSPK